MPTDSSPDRFPWSEDHIASRIRDAVGHYWKTRGNQAGEAEQSAEDARGGKHLDGFVGILTDLARLAGFEESEMRSRSRLELPGYYRATKQWDLLVIRGSRLCAAMEMKSQVGPSFGNNHNNRVEEAVGSSEDLWTAYREGRLGAQSPYVGYFFMLEDAAGVHRIIRKRPDSVFRPDPVFDNTSYAARYEILCRRLVLERKYSASCLLLAPRGLTGEYREPSPELSFANLARAFYGHLIGCA
ncbi:MAG TPA: PaeR7I family type II restriction endonuclease [Longimicrobium sp.]|jgi:hypothetical protein